MARGPVGRGGLIPCPTATETGVWGSLLYPVWDGAGIALLVVFPPLLGLGSMLALDGVALSPEGLVGGLMGLLLLLPSVALVGLLLGYAMLFLDRFLVASVEGETVHPTWPMIEFFAILAAIVRWLWAGASGLALGAIPAWLYASIHGINGPLDRLAFAELLTLGAGFGQMTLAASVLHNHVLAASPLTVIRAIRRIGWAYVPSCLVTTTILALLVFAGAVVLQPAGALVTAIAVWGFWVLALYGALVSLRVLGVCYHRHRARIGWFGEKERWGGWQMADGRSQMADPRWQMADGDI